MPNRCTLTLVSLLAATLWGGAPGAAAAPGPNVSYFKLGNGLEVVVIPDRRAPVVTHMIWYKVGAADEPPGKSGIAHFLEHLMFKGTRKNPAGKFSKAIAALGGHENAFTSADYTGYFQRTAREHLKMLMEFEADRMTGLVLTDAVVRPELNVVLEEENQRGSSPAAKLAKQMEAALYLNHPYGKPVIGWRHEIEKLTRQDALAFYRRFYTPNNAVLVIAGDVTVEDVRRLAQATYGKIKPRGKIVPRQRPQEPEQLAPRHIELADPRVAQPSLHRYYLVPSGATAKPGEAEALDVLAHILGGGATSRLHRALVVERNVAVSTGAWYSEAALDATRFSMSGTPKPNVSLRELEQAIDSVIGEVIARGVSADELNRAQNRLIADAVFALDNQATLARWYGVALTTGSTVERVNTWPDRIRAVTAEAVQQAARTWLDKRRSVTGYLVKHSASETDKRS